MLAVALAGLLALEGGGEDDEEDGIDLTVGP
jgi:hypothetical protein